MLRQCFPILAKVFPGKLVILQIDYKEVMGNKESPEFLIASIRITDEVSNMFLYLVF